MEIISYRSSIRMKIVYCNSFLLIFHYCRKLFAKVAPSINKKNLKIISTNPKAPSSLSFLFDLNDLVYIQHFFNEPINAISRMKCSKTNLTHHGSALVGSDPHELTPEFEVCQMKGTHTYSGLRTDLV